MDDETSIIRSHATGRIFDVRRGLHAQPVMLFMLRTALYVFIKVLDQQYAGKHGAVTTSSALKNVNIPVE